MIEWMKFMIENNLSECYEVFTYDNGIIDYFSTLDKAIECAKNIDNAYISKYTKEPHNGSHLDLEWFYKIWSESQNTYLKSKTNENS